MRYKRYLPVIALFVVHAMGLLILNFFPYPELFVYPYLTSKGLLPYSQILDQHFPGVMFFPVNLYNLGFQSPFSMRLLQLGLIFLTHILIFLIASKTIKKRYVLLPNVLYVLWQPFFEGYVLWIDSFMPLFLLSAYWIVIKEKQLSRRAVFFVGLLLGLALLFKQVVGPIIIVLGIVILLRYRLQRPTFYVCYAAGIILPVAFLILYIFSLGVWDDFFYWTVTFNITTFADSGRKYATLAELIKTAPVYLGSLAACLIILRMRVAKKYHFLIAFFLSSLVFAYARFDFVHLQPSLPFAILLITIAFINVRLPIKKLMGSLFLLLTVPLLVHFYFNNVGSKVYFWGEQELEVSRAVSQYTSRNDKVFALGTMPHIYALTETLPPGQVFIFQFPWFMMEAESRIYNALVSDPPKVVARDPLSTTDGKMLSDYMYKITDFVESNYKLENIVEGVEIWLPRK